MFEPSSSSRAADDTAEVRQLESTRRLGGTLALVVGFVQDALQSVRETLTSGTSLSNSAWIL